MLKFVKRSLSLIVIATLAMTGISVIAQSSNSPATANGEFRSSFGTEFWFHWDSNFGNTDFEPRLFIAAAADSTVTITYPDDSIEVVNVAAGDVANVDARAIFESDSHNDTNLSTRDIGVNVTATAPISVYLLNLFGGTSEASMAYPSDFLGKRYRIVTAAAELTNTSNVRFSVLAAEEGTTSIDVTSTAGFTQTYSLEQGEVFTQRGNAASMQGYLVESDKRVAVTTGAPFISFVGGSAGDTLMESLAPTETWGKNYLVPKTQNADFPDGLVVVADEDGTTVNINGSDVSLDAGESYYFTSGTTSGSVEVISADKKIGVMQMVRYGSYTDGVTTTTGDPAIVMMVPTEQFLNDFLISTPGDQFTVNQISIIAKTSDVGNVQLDGSAVGAENFTLIGDTEYAFASVNISQGQHRISSDDGFQVYTYGYNDNDSFAYPGGTGLVDTLLNPGGTADTGFRTLEQVISGASPYEISYSLNGGEGTVPTSTSGFGPQTISSVTPTRDGFAFVGWNTSADGTGTRVLAGESWEPDPVESIQLFAEWAAPHTVTFSPNYGSGISDKTQLIFPEQSTQLSQSFNRSGYSFVEWTTGSDGTGDSYALAEAVTISGDLTLYAQWSADTYTFTFEYDGATDGNSLASLDYTTDGEPVTLPTPTKPDFVFDGWYEASDFSGSEATSPYTTTADKTLYAKWIEADRSVTPGFIITNIGGGNTGTPYETFSGQTVRVDGEKLSRVTKVFVDGKEGTVVSTANDHFVMITPEGLTPGTYDLVVQSSIGELIYQDGFVVTAASENFAAANVACDGVEPSWWTQRISDTQAKVYIKCPAVGQKYRILHQTGGSGSYDSIFAKTLNDENDQTQVFNEFGRYIVRTIDLEDINRIRIRVDDEELWKVRYNR